MYLSEMAPPQYRGVINNGFELCLSLGILCANILNYFVVKIKAGWGWRISLSMAVLPAAFLTMGAIFLPETPSFIIHRDGDTDKARVLLQKLWGTDSVQKELDDLISASNHSRTTRYPFRNIFKRKYRPQFVIAVLIPFFNQVTGINVINFYAPVMFRTIGLKENASLLSSVVTRLCATFANIVAMILVNRSGRRKLHSPCRKYPDDLVAVHCGCNPDCKVQGPWVNGQGLCIPSIDNNVCVCCRIWMVLEASHILGSC